MADVEHRILPKGKSFTTSQNGRPFIVEGEHGLEIKPKLDSDGNILSGAWITINRTTVWHFGKYFTFPPHPRPSETIRARKSDTKPVQRDRR